MYLEYTQRNSSICEEQEGMNEIIWNTEAEEEPRKKMWGKLWKINFHALGVCVKIYILPLHRLWFYKLFIQRNNEMEQIGWLGSMGD